MVISGQCVRAEFAAEPQSPLLARRLVRSTLHGWHLDHLEETATLLVSELATNAVLHARTRFLLVAEQRDALVRVSVFDCAATAPARRHHGVQSGTGRGIGLIAVLACSWGTHTEVRPWAKVVWFELPTDPEALPQPADGALLAGWPA